MRKFPAKASRPASNPYRRILVGIDFSYASRAALAHAIALARRVGAELDVVHVVEKVQPALPFSAQNRAVVTRLRNEIVSQAKRELARLVPPTTALTLHRHVLSGVPHAQILEHARRTRADLIVLANRGHGLVEELLIGSTAERVVHHSRVPVLLIPSSGRKRKHSRRAP